MSKKEAFDIKAELRVHIARYHKTQVAAAKAWGCSTTFVSAVLRGAKVPNPKMLKDLGLRAVRQPVKYEKV